MEDGGDSSPRGDINSLLDEPIENEPKKPNIKAKLEAAKKAKEEAAAQARQQQEHYD